MKKESILDQLLRVKADLLREIEDLNSDLKDYDIAISALTPIKQEKLVENMDRMLERMTPEELAAAHSRFDERMESQIYPEQPTQEPKLPYRIKTREEMLASGAMAYSDGSIRPDVYKYTWEKEMDYLHGAPLMANEYQEIPKNKGGIPWRIDTWMITKNN